MTAAPFSTLLALLAACAASGPPSAPPPAPPPAAAPAPRAAEPPAPAPGPGTGSTPVPAPAPEVDDLLRRLEHAADGLRTISARIVYRSWDAVLEQQELRSGELVYEVGAERRRLGVSFDRVVRDTRADASRKDYIFDGNWLAEVDHARKLLIKRQIAEPGRSFDPLRLGEGPFPLPIGQKRDDVVARFDAAVLEKTGDPWLAERLAGREVVGLLLVPRPGTKHARDFTRLELFYDAQTLLPAGVHAVERKGDTRTVYLFEQKRNSPVAEERLTIPQPDPREWEIDVQPWAD